MKSSAIFPKKHFKDRLPRLQLVFMLWPLPWFFQLLIKKGKLISIDTAGKSALKQGNFPSLRVIRPKTE